MALPIDMIDQVLYRLPAKPLLRFRCVSKEWCSLIDSNDFVKKHLRNTLVCNAGVGLLVIKIQGVARYYWTGFDSLDDESPAGVVKVSEPLERFLSDAQIVGACNGLMCVFKNKRRDVFLLNPTTRKYRKIPGVPSEFPDSFSRTEKHLCGFGYDEVNDDFKVVMVAECYVQFRGLIAMVYSLKTNAWTRVQNVPNNIHFGRFRGLYASGYLYWMATEDQTSGKDIIVGFDLELQQFKEVPFPPIEETCVVFNREIYFVDVGEYLCILDCNDTCTDVWLMNYPGAQGTWYKALWLVQAGLVGIYRFSKIVALSRNGEDLLLLTYNEYITKLAWFSNLHQKTVKNVTIPGIPVHFCSVLCTESLVQLTGDEPLQQKSLKDKPKKKHKEKRRNRQRG